MDIYNQKHMIRFKKNMEGSGQKSQWISEDLSIDSSIPIRSLVLHCGCCDTSHNSRAGKGDGRIPGAHDQPTATHSCTPGSGKDPGLKT